MAGGSLFQISEKVTVRYWRVLFIGMLVLLHLVALRGGEGFWARALMLAHFGLFIIWQPFMRGEERLTVQQMVLVIAISAATLLFLNWWLLTLWTAVFAGIVGGKVFLFQAPRLRRFYLAVLLYVLGLLLAWVVPNTVLGSALARELEMFAEYGLPLLFVVMAFMPVEADAAESPQIVDFFYATLLFLLLVVLVLGSLAFMRVGGLDYGLALAYSLLIIATVLFLLSAAWNPRAGFSGLSMYFSRYLLSIGLPFEQWLSLLAEMSQVEPRADRFLKDACGGLARLPWVTGGVWRAGDESGEFGKTSKNSVEYANQELHLRVFTHYELSPSLVWHFNLLGELLGEFYIAKLREQKLQQQTYLQAVHETGARMTHDVKNLLQSLNVLCSVALRPEAEETPEQRALLRRQLPVIAQRLSGTLEKLQHPRPGGDERIDAAEWWAALGRQYRAAGVAFAERELRPGLMIPRAMAESVADNLLQNALAKRKVDPSVQVRAELQCTGELQFRVCDSGKAVPAEVERGLFQAPLRSTTDGLGIGLYQSSRQAQANGFSLTLERNRDGDVCFLLASA